MGNQYLLTINFILAFVFNELSPKDALQIKPQDYVQIQQTTNHHYTLLWNN